MPIYFMLCSSLMNFVSMVICNCLSGGFFGGWGDGIKQNLFYGY